MKNIIFLIAAAFCFMSFTVSDLRGVWKNHTVTYTFTKDSLYIDEETSDGSEGFGYKYTLTGRTVKFHDENFTGEFTIVSTSEGAMTIKYAGEDIQHTFKKVKLHIHKKQHIQTIAARITQHVL